MRKTYLRPLIFAASLIIVFIVAGCTKLCNSGYEGSRCNQLTTTKFIARWNAVDTPGNLTYTDTINQGPEINDITLSTSFAGHHFSHIINASVANNVITIPYQQPDSGGNFVKGTGTISDNQDSILFAYQIISGVDSPQLVTNYAGTWLRAN
jgi:hypothetical protein